VQTKVGARKRKGVDRAVATQQNLPSIGLVQFGWSRSPRWRAAQQGLPDALHVLHQNRIVHIVRVAVQLSGNAVAQRRSALGVMSVPSPRLGRAELEVLARLPSTWALSATGIPIAIKIIADRPIFDRARP
jgi:hypothetical protein